MLFLESTRQYDSALDVLGLGGLVASNQEKQEAIATLRVINAVSRTEVDLQLRYAFRQVAVSAGIPVNQPVNANLNLGAANPVLQGVDPVALDLGLLNAHRSIVAARLQQRKRAGDAHCEAERLR